LDASIDSALWPRHRLPFDGYAFFVCSAHDAWSPDSQPNSITRRIRDVLVYPEVSLRCLNAGVPERLLNLLDAGLPFITPENDSCEILIQSLILGRFSLG
jgi:hypothetical protein